MKKLLFLFVMTAFAAVSKGQNVQLHYDFGDGRNYLTSTVEMFRPDNHGSTFFFVDMNYSEDGVDNAYWEIARDLNFWQDKTPLSFHAEYNGGLFLSGNPDQFGAYEGRTVNNAFLFGASYGFNNEDYSKGITFQALYKYIQKNPFGEYNNFQLTAVWYMHFFDRKLSFTGFADFWKEKHNVFDDNLNISEADYVFLTEPQIWYNVNENFSVGSEIEISTDFAGNDGFMINPTIAAKYTF